MLYQFMIIRKYGDKFYTNSRGLNVPEAGVVLILMDGILPRY